MNFDECNDDELICSKCHEETDELSLFGDLCDRCEAQLEDHGDFRADR
jgi:predicted amidophosphoribosyltransferase